MRPEHVLLNIIMVTRNNNCSNLCFSKIHVINTAKNICVENCSMISESKKYHNVLNHVPMKFSFFIL